MLWHNKLKVWDELRPSKQKTIGKSGRSHGWLLNMSSVLQSYIPHLMCMCYYTANIRYVMSSVHTRKETENRGASTVDFHICPNDVWLDHCLWRQRSIAHILCHSRLSDMMLVRCRHQNMIIMSAQWDWHIYVHNLWRVVVMGIWGPCWRLAAIAIHGLR